MLQAGPRCGDAERWRGGSLREQGSQVTEDAAGARSSNCLQGTLGLMTVVRKEQDGPSLLP